MAVKVFCNVCHHFIKDVNKGDLRNLTGDEICPSCSEISLSIFKEVDTIAKRGIIEIEKDRDKIKAKMENLARKVLNPDG